MPLHDGLRDGLALILEKSLDLAVFEGKVLLALVDSHLLPCHLFGCLEKLVLEKLHLFIGMVLSVLSAPCQVGLSRHIIHFCLQILNHGLFLHELTLQELGLPGSPKVGVEVPMGKKELDLTNRNFSDFFERP